MTIAELTTFKTLLKQHGHQCTRARIATFELLISSEPQTLNEIITSGQGLVDRVSIYRNIALFEKLGIAHRIYIGWKYKIELSDEFTAHHHHLSCLRCGKVIDIEDERHIDEFIHEVTNRFGFQPRRHQFEVEGYCRDCLRASPIQMSSS